MELEDLMYQRDQIARTYGFELWERYTEPQVAALLAKRKPGDKNNDPVDTSTLKRNRAKRLIPFRQEPGGGIFYLGIMVADIIAFGKDAILLHPDPPFAKLAMQGFQGEIRGTSNVVAEALKRK